MLRSAPFRAAFGLVVLLLVVGCANDFEPGSDPDRLTYKAVTVFFYGTQRNRFVESDFRGSLDEIAATGANTVFLVPYWFQTDHRTDIIEAEFDFRTILDSDFRRACQLVRERGLGLAIKPHIDLDDGKPRSEISPADPGAWKASYLEFILHYARMAEEEDAEIFCVGTELAGVSGDRALWDEIIDAVKREYRGRLTYAPMPQEALSVRFFDRLDFIGLNAYFPVSKKSDPRLEDLLFTWGTWAQMIRDLAGAYGREVLITEIGYMNRKGAAADPGNFLIDGAPDEQLQADLYRAALMASEEIPSLAGMVWWQWELGDVGGAGNVDYTPRGKKAEQVLKEFWQ